MINKKKFNQVVTELFIRGTLIFVFITQLYFKLPKDVRLNSIHVFIRKIPNKENFNKLN